MHSYISMVIKMELQNLRHLQLNDLRFIPEITCFFSTIQPEQHQFLVTFGTAFSGWIFRSAHSHCQISLSSKRCV